MRIIHIVEEISQKNSSINNTVRLLSSYKSVKRSIIVSPKGKNYLNDRKIKELNYFDILDFLKKNKPDIIHIHGLWRLFFLAFILKAKTLKIPVVIQSHGMLLKEAMKSKSKIKYIFKIIFIQFYKIFKDTLSFIAITKEEKLSILKIFKNNNIALIPNPIQFRKVPLKNKKILSFFGRINKHKNIELMINSFISSNLDKSWKFHIYGINDDKKYYLKCKKVINDKGFGNRIYFKKPIFNIDKKLAKMSEVYLNILISKSEVMGLTVLECLSVGTKSLVNISFDYPKIISKYLYYTKPNKKEIAIKIKKVCSLYKKNYNKKLLSSNFKKKYEQLCVEKNYLNFLKNLSFN